MIHVFSYLLSILFCFVSLMHLPLWNSQFDCMGLCVMAIKVYHILYEVPYFGGNSVLSAPRSSPALQVAEVQQVKLSAVLGVIDGVHILGATLPMSVFAAVQYMTPAHFEHSAVRNTQKHSKRHRHSPTALTHCTSSLQLMPL